jgi:general secretion pathway protein D
VTVFATQRQHKAIQKYLQEVLDSVNQQVLIEAKILEVTLDDQYRAGINWTAALGPDSEKFRINSNFSRDVVPPDFANPTLSGVWSLARGQTINGQFVSDLTAAAQLIKKFGTVRALSNPRLTVVNNQTAVLKVAKNQVFFEIEVTTTDSTATTAGRTTVSSEIKTVPVGVVMTVQPAVDPVSRKISLSLRPSITRITGFVPDPGVQLTIAQFNQANPNAAQNISSLVPIIEAREFDSMVTMDSGETIVMGGLMQDAATNIREGIPGAMDIPILGQALSQNIKQNSVSELVIFIKATLVTARGTVADEDIRLYKTFTPDPRPVTF